QSLNLGSGGVTLGGNRQVTVSANTLTAGGAISDSSIGYSLTKAGSGILVMNGANTISGGLIINAGTVQMGSSTATLPNAVSFTGAGTLALAGTVGGTAFTIPSLSGSAGTINNASGTVTLRINSAADGSFGGTLADAGGILIFEKRGVSTTTFTLTG